MLNGPGKLTDSDREIAARQASRYVKHARVFALLDGALDVLLAWKVVADRPAVAPKKLLVCNYGHIGDMLITLSLLEAVKKAFPGVEIGVLCGSWNKPVVEGNALITRAHYLDHWYLVRGAKTRRERMAAYASRLPWLVSELRAEGYDAAVDVRRWFPNAIPVMWLAGIPMRAGFTRVGFAPLLTHEVVHAYTRNHERDYQASILRCLPIEGSLLEIIPVRSLEPPGSGRELFAARTGLSADTRYVVLHPGGSTEARNWTEEGWCELASRVLDTGAVPTFTGLGPVQQQLIERILSRVHGAVSLCNQLGWNELVSLLADAELVYSVETSVGHLAGALGVPNVSIYGGMSDPKQWKPAGRRVALVSRQLACSPCFIPAGCEERACLSSITAQEVWAAGRQLVASEPAGAVAAKFT